MGAYLRSLFERRRERDLFRLAASAVWYARASTTASASTRCAEGSPVLGSGKFPFTKPSSTLQLEFEPIAIAAVALGLDWEVGGDGEWQTIS